LVAAFRIAPPTAVLARACEAIGSVADDQRAADKTATGFVGAAQQNPRRGKQQ
jgi:hypothetical protein